MLFKNSLSKTTYIQKSSESVAACEKFGNKGNQNKPRKDGVEKRVRKFF